MVNPGLGNVPGSICGFFAADSSGFASVSELCLKTTGAREIVPGVDSADGSSKFAYSDMPPLLRGAGSGAMVVLMKLLVAERKKQ